ncbi:MAG: hypothetical protein HY698_21885, partial [Deltaproteobacteria bacterium]|nr:hypothetical protein [Deltaproteobacteria bacterium]
MLEGRPPHSLRRRIAGLIILFGVIYIGGRFLSSSARVVRVEIHFHLRNHAEVESLEAEIVPHGGDEPVARFATKLVEK